MTSRNAQQQLVKPQVILQSLICQHPSWVCEVGGLTGRLCLPTQGGKHNRWGAFKNFVCCPHCGSYQSVCRDRGKKKGQAEEKLVWRHKDTWSIWKCLIWWFPAYTHIALSGLSTIWAILPLTSAQTHSFVAPQKKTTGVTPKITLGPAGLQHVLTHAKTHTATKELRLTHDSGSQYLRRRLGFSAGLPQTPPPPPPPSPLCHHPSVTSPPRSWPFLTILPTQVLQSFHLLLLTVSYLLKSIKHKINIVVYYNTIMTWY